METEQRNKRAVAAFFERISAGDLDGVLAMLANDATWWIAGKPDRLPTAGLYAKPRVAKLLRGMQGGLQFHFLLAFREGSIVAVREYLDMQHAHDVWVQADAPAT